MEDNLFYLHCLYPPSLDFLSCSLKVHPLVSVQMSQMKLWRTLMGPVIHSRSRSMEKASLPMNHLAKYTKFVHCDFFLQSYYNFLRLYFFFSTILGLQKNGGKDKKISYTVYPWLFTHIDSLIINISHKSGTFVIIDKPILTYYNYLKSIVYIKVYSWY